MKKSQLFLIATMLLAPILAFAIDPTSRPMKYAEKDAKWEATRAPGGSFYKCYDNGINEDDGHWKIDCLVIANGGHPELPTVLTVRVKYDFRPIGSGQYVLNDKDYESIE